MKKTYYLLIFFVMFSYQSIAVDFYIGNLVVAPVSGCSLSNSELVTIYIGNAGGITTSNTNFDISYTVNGVTVTENYTVNAGWASSATFSYTFGTNADLSSCQEYIFNFDLILPTDSNLGNNTLTTSIFSDCEPTLGNITAPATVCDGNNIGMLNISGYNGVVIDWQYSTDSGVNWIGTGNTADDENYNNLSIQTDYWVIMNSPFGYCNADTTPVTTIMIDQLSVGGVLNSNQNVCSNGNSGILDLSGFTGDIINWETSIDGGITWNNFPFTNDTLEYIDIFTTTQYQVTVQNGTCPSDVSLIAELTVIAGSDAGLIIGEDTVCNAMADSLLSLNGYYGNIQTWIYSTDSGATWIDANVSAASFSYAALLGYTIFGAVVQEQNCPIDTAFHPIIVLPTSVTGGPNLIITEGDTVQLLGSGGVSYLWTPGSYMDSEFNQNPLVWPTQDITYSVEVTDQYNCKDTAFVIIIVEPDLGNIIIPNLLTPNGDGYNDILQIENILSYDQSEMNIFDAYGKVIFQASPYLNDWDAKLNGNTLPDGTYFYVLNLADGLPLRKGTITIVSKK